MWQTDQRCRHGVGVVWLCGLTLVGGGLVPQTASAAAPFTLTQITTTPSSCSGTFNPAINADGTRITFDSDCDLTPGSPGNADGNFEMFLVKTATSAVTQVTNSTGCVSENKNRAINADGTRITFDSDCDLTPGSPGNADGSSHNSALRDDLAARACTRRCARALLRYGCALSVSSAADQIP